MIKSVAVKDEKNNFQHLLSNAVKYSGHKGNILFSTEVNETSVTIKVKGYGIGIPLKDQPFIFNRFFSANNVLTEQGTGMGQSMVNEYRNCLVVLYISKVKKERNYFLCELSALR